ncbi:hypothetical protein H5410_036204 [Solanum commersonii]|uniref:Uncharacterized protein n=1 Tax=Solanum commersonii TaxID=4109 RepID=A0A9J5Y6V0_SOLCO|nr:hypothetical protein H5410_036204 [Solanum commersonii]
MQSPQMDKAEGARRWRVNSEHSGVDLQRFDIQKVSSQKGEDNLLGFTEVTGHVGSSEKEILKEKRGVEIAMGNITSTCIQGKNPQSTEVVSTSLTPFEEVVPLNQLSPEEGDDPEFDVSIWIH